VIAAVARRPAPPLASSRGAPLRPTIVEGPLDAGRPQVQLGAWRTEQEARDGWTVAQDGAGGLLDELMPVIVRAEIPGRGVFYRLRVAPGQMPAQFCAALAKRNLGCVPAPR